MNSKIVTIFFVALSLMLLLSVGGSFWDGSIDLLLHDNGNWKFPKTLFVFWLGMSPSGILLSAFLLIMKVKIHRRTSLLLELSSFCCLAVSFFYALLYENSLAMNCNVYSIGIVGFISLLYFVTHLIAADSAEDMAICKELSKIRRPLAWIILPTVFWVVSAFGLDFARVENPFWQGAFFPLYLVACTFYLGLAIAVALLLFENYFNRLIERFLVLCSWFMLLMFLWIILLRGEGCFTSFVFCCLIPQLLFIEAVRENVWGRLVVVMSILFGILLKCDYLVNSNDLLFFSNANFADVSLILAGAMLFVTLFLGVRFLLSRFFENDEILMGEVDSSLDSSDGEVPDENEKKYYPSFSAPEFKVVRLPVLCGVLAAVAYGYFTSDWINLAGPFGACVGCMLVCLQPFVHLGFFRKRREEGRK